MQPNSDFSNNSIHLGAYSQTSQDVEIMRPRETHVDKSLAVFLDIQVSPRHPPLNLDILIRLLTLRGGILAIHVKYQ